MDWCAASGHILASPVGVVTRLLPKQPGKRQRAAHQPAMPWRRMPDFVRNVLHVGATSTSKVMLEFLILTAARSGEVRQMDWREINLADAVWTIPASRMKAKTAHRIPLSNRALDILAAKRSNAAMHKGLVFPSRNGLPISDVMLTKFLRDRKVESDVPERHATAHGFRSSFRDWASEHGYSRDLAERALAHTIKSSTEAAYHRTDLLDQRRTMMTDWGEYISGSNDL